MILKRILSFWLLTTLLVSTAGYCGDVPPLPSGDHASSAGSDPNAPGNGTDLKGASIAAGGSGGGASQGMVYQLDAVRVVADKIEAGKTTIGEEELKSMPSRTGSITEALKVVPNVQFSNEESSSLMMGEVSPPRVSISGGKPYENNFLVDGLSVSNTLDPTGLSDIGDPINGAYLNGNGGDQNIFYDTKLLDSITVYSSNVPAKYGNFLGGVIDAKIVDPRSDHWHAVLTGRHARSEWFDLRGVDEDSYSPDNQPKFRLNSFSAVTDGPVTEKMALLLAVSRRWSEIPLMYKEADRSISKKEQSRSSDNFYAKTVLYPQDELKVTFDAAYAPYSDKRWMTPASLNSPPWPDGGWRIENEALRFGNSVEWDSKLGTFNGRVAYSENGFSRYSDTNYYFADTVNNTREGGFGDATVDSREFDAKLEFEFKEFEAVGVQWNISSGIDFSRVVTDMWNEASRTESFSKSSHVVIDYIEEEQAGSLNRYGFFFQTEATFGRFTLTPGLRLDYDDFTCNTNVAPRIKAEYDTFGDGQLRWVAGVNRYYGSQLRAYAFDRYRPYYRATTSLKTGKTVYAIGKDKSYLASGLDTPYSDELMAGILGDINGFEYSLELVHRNFQDQLTSVTEDGELYRMTNDGSSSFKGVKFSLEKTIETEKYGLHSFNFGASKSITRTFNGGYDSDNRVNTVINGYDYDYGRVYYDGTHLSREEMPAEDFNAPLVLTLSWMGSFYEDSVRVHCVSRWRDSTSGLLADRRASDETPYGTATPRSSSSQWLNEDGSYSDAYRKGVISGGLVTDASFEWDVLKKDFVTFTLLLDITNIFDSTLHTGAAETGELRSFVSGRGYYAGIRCEF